MLNILDKFETAWGADLGISCGPDADIAVICMPVSLCYHMYAGVYITW
jgi:hypothetical protein